MIMPMKDNKGKNKLEKADKRNTGAAADGTAVSYTPEQRRLIRNGLGIWARVAIRSYLRKHVAQGQNEPETDPVEGEED